MSHISRTIARELNKGFGSLKVADHNNRRQKNAGDESGRNVNMSIKMCITVRNMEIAYLLNPSSRAEYDSRSHFLAEFYRFELRVSLLLDWLPYRG